MGAARVRIACGAWHADRAIAARMDGLGPLDRFKYLSHKRMRWFSGLWLAGAAASGTAWLHTHGMAQTAAPALALLLALCPPARRIALGMLATTAGVALAMLGWAAGGLDTGTEVADMSRRVLAIVPDAGEPRTAQDIAALRRAGLFVRVASFTRTGDPEAELRLGPLPAGTGPGRAVALLRALRHLPRLRRCMAGADVVLARNLDMAALALLVAATLGQRPPLVYQCLDIHGLLTRRGWLARLARWLERRVLARTDRLVVSAPAFLEHHFRHQADPLPDLLLRENRLTPRTAPPRGRASPRGRCAWGGWAACAAPPALHC